MLTACTHCHRRFVVSERTIGRAARCTYCNERFLIEPHYSEDLSLSGDEEELVRSLNLPTLEDIEDSVQPPDVDAAVAVKRQGIKAPPGITPPPEFQDTEGRRGVAGLLLVLFVAGVVAYGIWAGARVPATAAAARDTFNIEVSSDTWSRVWRPLLTLAGMVVALVGPVFWAGAQIGARLLRMRYTTSGLAESCAIATVPMALPLLAIVAFGTDDSRLVIPALLAAFPAVCLLVPSLFGMPLAKGLTTAAICLAMAAPAYTFVGFWAASVQSSAVAADDARIARAVERKKQQLAESPATAPSQAGAASIVNKLAAEITPERVLAKSTAPATQEALSAVPTIPPPVMEIKPATVPPVAEQAVSPATAPAVAAEPTVRPATVSPSLGAARAAPAYLRIWREAGTPQQVIWPAVPGNTFATVRLDQYGNHLLEFWASDSMQRRGALHLGGGSGVSYAICPAGETLLRVIDGASPVAELWSLADNARKIQIPLTAEQAEPRALGFLDKQTFAVLSRQGAEGSVDLYDTKRATVRRRISWEALPSGSAAGTTSTPENVVISPDGKYLALVNSARRLDLIDVSSGAAKRYAPLNLAKAESADVTAIAFSPDGSMIAVLLDESHALSRAALFCGSTQMLDLAAISFSDPLWKQAGCPRTQGKRVGRAVDWISPRELLVYGELVIEPTTGTVVRGVHGRGNGFAGAAFSQYRLPDGSFLLQPFPDAQSRGLPLQRLRTDLLLSTREE